MCSSMQWLVGERSKVSFVALFSPSNFVWVPGIELGSSAFVAIAFTHEVFPLAKNGFL